MENISVEDMVMSATMQARGMCMDARAQAQGNRGRVIIVHMGRARVSTVISVHKVRGARMGTEMAY